MEITMDEPKDVLRTLILGIAKSLKPLADAVVTTEGLIEILDEIGANPSEDLTSGEQEALRSALELALAPFNNPSNVEEIISNLPHLMNTFTNHLPSALADMGSNLVDALIVSFLQREAPQVFALMMFLGLSELEQMPPSRLTGRVRSRWRIRWERIPKVLSDPSLLFGEVYGWGTDFKPELLLRNFRTLLLFAGIPAGFQDDDQDGIRAITTIAQPVLRVPLLIHEDGSKMFEAGLALLPTRNDANVRFDGLALVPFGLVQISTDVDFGQGWTFHTRSISNVPAGFGLILKEQGHLEPKLLDGSDSTGLTINLSAGIEKISSTEPVIIFGDERTSRLEAGAIGVYSEADVSLDGESEFRFEAHIKSGRVVISTTASDSFISKILPKAGFEAPFEVVIGWSNLRGIYFRGSANLEITIPIHAGLGPIELEALNLVVVLGGDPALLEVQLGLDVRARMGPLSISISRVGAQVDVSVSRTPDLLLGFLPPKGAGLSLNTGLIIGGGFLKVDDPKKQYAGILALKAAEIGLTAIGLITTRMPDGSEGFSLLISIGVVFAPAIPLSYGFELQGVGGLIGVNRNMSTEALQAGLRAKALDSILFPDPATVVENAQKIISDLSAVFPPAEGRFVIGPMVKIGWGAGKISAEIGIFISIPMPVSVALLGQVSAFFPEPGENAIVELNMDILGILDLGKSMLTFQASLRDSNILKTYTLYGDSAFLLSWGNSPQFALSMGGFHPKFDPPPPPIVFSGLKRLGINMSAGNNFSMVCEAYQALTPNTLQFGALVDLYAKESGALFRGHVAFDTLIYFSPFSLEAAVSAQVGVEFKGRDLAHARLAFVLTGPTPWRARGKAKIKLLCFEGEKSFNFHWGAEKQLTLEAVDPWKLITEPVNQTEVGNKNISWNSALPPGMRTVECLVADIKSDGDILLANPAGTLQVRQQVVPLNKQLAMVGNAPVKDHNLIKIEKIELGYLDSKGEFVADSEAAMSLEDTFEYFARAQFEKLSDSQTLSVPSFEQMVAGAVARMSGVQTDGSLEDKTLEYESILLTKNPVQFSDDGNTLTPARRWKQPNRGKKTFELEGEILCAGASRVRQAAAGASMAPRAASQTRRVQVIEESFRIVNKDDLKAADGIEQPDGGFSRSQADRILASLDAGKRASLQIVSRWEDEGDQ
jgi:hypothetical protein